MQLILKNDKHMKNLILLLLLTFFNLNCKSQTIIPIEKVIEYKYLKKDFPKNSYLKDVNNKLDIYTGTWKGTYGDKIFLLTFTKHTDVRENIKEDVLLMRYLITTDKGILLEDTRFLTDSDPFIVQGYYIEKSTYAMTYGGRNAKCGQTGTIFIDFLKDTNKSKMTLFLEPEQMMISYDECPNGRAKQIFPLDQITLTKQ